MSRALTLRERIVEITNKWEAMNSRILTGEVIHLLEEALELPDNPPPTSPIINMDFWNSFLNDPEH